MKNFKQAGRRVGKRGDWYVVICANRRPRTRIISTECFHHSSMSSTNNFLVSTLGQTNSCDLSWKSIHFIYFPFYRLHSGNQMGLSLSEKITRDEIHVHVTMKRDKFHIIKPTSRTNFSNLFLDWNSTCFGQFLCPSSGDFHRTHSNGICHTGLLTACEQDRDGTSSILYDIYHCCVYSEKLLMMDRGTVRNMQIFIPKINLRS